MSPRYPFAAQRRDLALHAVRASPPRQPRDLIDVTRGFQQQINWILFGILTYVASQIVIGAWVAKRNVTEDDYLLAGRSLGLTVSTMTIFATWFGAETCIGSAGAIFEEGLAYGVVSVWERGRVELADDYARSED